MAIFDTTATCQADCRLSEAAPNTSYGEDLLNLLVRSWAGPPVDNWRTILGFRLPDKPYGADRITSTKIVIQRTSTVVGSGPKRSYKVLSVSRPWTEASATWNVYAGTGATWTTPGGDGDAEIAIKYLTAPGSSTGASFAFDISSMALDWGERGTVLLRDSVEGIALQQEMGFHSLVTTATVAWMPHVVVTAEDDAPPAINDLSISPDLSLSEASYTYRQRARLSWSKSGASDFKRYRLRYGINRALSTNHIHLAFLNSLASAAYLDTSIYSGGSTIYYSLYVEDTRNGSTSTFLGASTYCNVSNVVSWQKPYAIIGRVDDATPDVLQEIEANVRTTATFGMANLKKAKIVWGDGGYSYSQSLTSAGGYFFKRHRYSKATSVTLRAQVEDLLGFRSAPVTFSTSIVAANLGPIAKITASPARQRTASTFGVGVAGASTGSFSASFLTIGLGATFAVPVDGVGLSFRFHTSGHPGTTGTFFGLQLRREGSYYRIINSKGFTTATADAVIRRDINWHLRKGDAIGLHVPRNPLGGNEVGAVTGTKLYLSLSTVLAVGDRVGIYRFSSDNEAPAIRVTNALTNPVHFSARDSLARSSNRWINRHRWDVNYNGAFSGDYDTEGTTSFFYAWTSATHAFVAVRAVDDSHASSIDVAGVRVETEATFRIPDGLTHGMKAIRDNRRRAASQRALLGVDYGALDLGALEPATLEIEGVARTNATTATWDDIDRLSAAFQQTKRVYVVPPWSTSTAVQGYLLEAPVTRDANDPVGKAWTVRLAVLP